MPIRGFKTIVTFKNGSSIVLSEVLDIRSPDSENLLGHEIMMFDYVGNPQHRDFKCDDIACIEMFPVPERKVRRGKTKETGSS